ncbi:hemerythrin domain-containing protein [Sphingomonas sp. ID1715]|uniref:hemerythrin domain-containing protein n=1 Tax=Sphingomonas sp. ID1715 TaxID=1656898 RepID=UPI001489CFC4|nr:hemerythrin domain-containing protein [Sphingomonas sp. ID1715]NNM75481.1 hemerythrin domain-containing protein [Sphingomonas sp. ID1715]
MATDASDRTRSSQQRSTGSRGNTEGGIFGGATGAMIGAAAAGVAVGLMANLGRKTAVQAPTFLAGEWDEALAAEHAATLKLFDALQATTEKNTTKRSMLLMQLKHALAKHALQEENAVYPALRDAGQTEQADHLNHDHGYVKQYLYDLDNMPNESPAFLTKVAEFRASIEEHMREEEDQIFPQLKAKLSVEQNKALTAAMNKEGFKLA